MVSRRTRRILIIAVCIAFLLTLLATPFLAARKKSTIVAEADLGEGRIFQVEAVTYGTNHQVGFESEALRRFGAWLPAKVRSALEPRVPRSTIEEDEPVLVIWLNAISSTFRTNVDCQGVRLELIDLAGTSYVDSQGSWHGFDRFWREAHVFRAFPRNSKTLDLKITSWNGTNSVGFNLPNPGYTEPAAWSGKLVPQRHRQGEYEVVLAAVAAVTNKGTYWKGKSAHWKPAFEIFRKGRKQEGGWDIEWIAEDAYGNRGQELGLTQPILKFIATCYPSSTNRDAAVFITNLPVANFRTTTNIWWNTPAMVTTNRVEVLGLFPAGVHTFSDGEYLTNPPVKFGPVQGGAPSGWVGTSRQTLLRTISYRGHYSDVPIVYVRVADPQSKQRIAMRLRDPENSAIFLTEPEPQGMGSDIAAFLIRTPSALTNASAELLLLPPLTAEFYVDTTIGFDANTGHPR